MNASGRNAGMHENIRRTIRMVPHGKVATYGAVARAAGYPGASRLVARVLQSSEGLPWQRILGAGGQIKLPGEAGMEQRFRLQMEGVTFRGRRVNMKLHEHRFSKKRLVKRKRAKSAGWNRPRIR